MDCMGCIYFYPKGEYLGYCEMMERVTSVNSGCDEGISIDLEEEVEND